MRRLQPETVGARQHVALDGVALSSFQITNAGLKELAALKQLQTLTLLALRSRTPG